MSSVVISGDTSGSVTLQAPAVSGSTTINLPTVSGGSFIVSNSSGNVTIGTSLTSGRLNVASTSGSSFGTNANTLNLVSTATAAVGVGPAISFQGNTGNSTDVYGFGGIAGFKESASAGNYAGALAFYTQNSGGSATYNEQMRIDSSGNVMINTTSVVNFSRFSVQEDLTSFNGIGIKNTGTTYGGSTDFIVFMNNVDAAAGRISQTAVTTVAYTTSSDYRLKENIVPMTGALDKVAALKPVTYTWKQDGSNGQGFIAHELQAVVPDCVTGEKDAVETYTDEDGIEQTKPKYQGVDTSFLVATLTAAIQEQQTIINDLKTRVEALENK
jgi:hypothetical protein